MTDFDAPEPWKFFHKLDMNATKTAIILESVLQDLKEIKEEQAKADERISALESRRWPAHAISVVLMIIGIAGFVFTLVKGGA